MVFRMLSCKHLPVAVLFSWFDGLNSLCIWSGKMLQVYVGFQRHHSAPTCLQQASHNVCFEHYMQSKVCTVAAQYIRNTWNLVIPWPVWSNWLWLLLLGKPLLLIIIAFAVCAIWQLLLRFFFLDCSNSECACWRHWLQHCCLQPRAARFVHGFVLLTCVAAPAAPTAATVLLYCLMQCRRCKAAFNNVGKRWWWGSQRLCSL